MTGHDDAGTSRGQDAWAQVCHRIGLLAARAEDAVAALVDADLVNPVTDQLLAAAPSVQQLSLRNCLLLMMQFQGQAGQALRDVDTYEGWIRRGRQPGQRCLYIIRPNDLSTSRTAPTSGRPGSGARSRGHRHGFRVASRWEFAQTTPCASVVNASAEPDPAGTPEDFAAALLTQLDRYGYRVQPGEMSAVDHATATVLIPESIWSDNSRQRVRVLIRSMADVLTYGPGRPRDHRLPALGALAPVHTGTPQRPLTRTGLR